MNIVNNISIRRHKTKRILSLLLCVSVLLCTLFSLSINSVASGESDFSYVELDDGTIKITEYNGSLLDIEIPSTIDGKQVTVIGDRLFYNKTTIKSVTIPVGVKTIESYAFYSCRALESIEIPYTVKEIGSWCFYNDVKLEKVVIPEGVELIDYRCFYGCTGLYELYVPASVTSIDTYAFYRVPTGAAIYTPEGSYAEEFFFGKGYNPTPTTYYELSVDRQAAQVKMTIDSYEQSGVKDNFSLRIISVIPADEWDRIVGNTTDKGTAETSVITSMGIVAYRGNGTFSEDTAKSVVNGGTAEDYSSATTTYICKTSDTSDATFGAIIKLNHSTTPNDITYMGFVKYIDSEGANRVVFYETSYVATVASQYDSIVSRYISSVS